MSGTGTTTDQPDANSDADEASRDSFPASDPPAQTPARGVGGGDPHADEAKGTPHSGRHETETAAGRQESHRPAERKAD